MGIPVRPCDLCWDASFAQQSDYRLEDLVGVRSKGLSNGPAESTSYVLPKGLTGEAFCGVLVWWCWAVYPDHPAFIGVAIGGMFTLALAFPNPRGTSPMSDWPTWAYTPRLNFHMGNLNPCPLVIPLPLEEEVEEEEEEAE